MRGGWGCARTCIEKPIRPAKDVTARRLGGVLLHVKHRSPDGDPRPSFVLEHPHIPSGCTISFARTLVNHFISQGAHRRIAGDIDLVIVLMEFLNLRALAEVSEPGKKAFPSLHPPAET